ncbi:MAG: nuclear transport factor 2 family protein [Solirubrobacterales bacterium]
MSDALPGEGGQGYEEKRRVVAEVMDAFNERDWKRFFAATTDDLLVRTDGRWPGGGVFQGREATMRFLEEFLDPWADVRYEPVGEPEPHGELLLQRGRWFAHGATTGLGGRIDFALVAEYREGRLSSAAFFLDYDEARAFAAAATGEGG